MIFDTQRKVLDEITDKVHSKLEQTNNHINSHNSNNAGYKFDQSTINPNASYNDYFVNTQNMTSAGKDLSVGNFGNTQGTLGFNGMKSDFP